MKKTLLLCFIHGFKGDDNTFGEKSEFALHLAALVSAALPKVSVRAITYPQYETRGDLHECVGRFRDWLLNRVIDLEVAAGTPSPTVEPSVRTILIGHSMGGIVAAETAIGIASEVPVPHTSKSKASHRDSLTVLVGESVGPTSLMFPYIQGVLAFDTPFLGISPGVVAHGAEGHYNSVNGALAQLNGLSTIFWNNYNQASGNTGGSSKKPTGALPAPETPQEKKKQSGGGWGWGQIAMVAGAAGALAAGGAAAYMNREHLTSGWTWVSSHLEFVGCLARGTELRERLAKMVKLDRQMGVGFANLYTRLGKAASSKEVSMVGTVVGNDRTFCNLPEKDKRTTGLWMEAINDKSKDEIGAHMAMFEPKDNPGYRKLSEDAKNLIVRWSKNEWYETSGRRAIQ